METSNKKKIIISVAIIILVGGLIYLLTNKSDENEGVLDNVEKTEKQEENVFVSKFDRFPEIEDHYEQQPLSDSDSAEALSEDILNTSGSEAGSLIESFGSSAI
jgi:predicted PurR-regulated permease PerM